MVNYFKNRIQKQMWKELKEFEDSPLYGMAVACWEVERYAKSYKCKILRFVNKLKKLCGIIGKDLRK